MEQTENKMPESGQQITIPCDELYNRLYARHIKMMSRRKKNTVAKVEKQDVEMVDKCFVNFEHDIDTLDQGTLKLVQGIKLMMEELKKYPSAKHLYRTQCAKVTQLESCIMCLRRTEMVLVERWDDLEQCRGETEISIKCLQADIREREIHVAHLEKEDVQTTENKDKELEKMERMEKFTVQIDNEIESLIFKSKQMSRSISDMYVQKQEKEQQFLIKHETLLEKYKQFFVFYEKTENGKIEYHNKLKKDVHKIKRSITLSLPQKLDYLKIVEKENRDEILKFTETNEKLVHQIKLMEKAICKNKAMFKICNCEKRHWEEAACKNKENIVTLSEELEQCSDKIKSFTMTSKTDVTKMNKDFCKVLDLKQKNDKTFEYLEKSMVFLEKLLKFEQKRQRDTEKRKEKYLTDNDFKANISEYDKIYSKLKQICLENNQLSTKEGHLERAKRQKERDFEVLEDERKELCAQYAALLKTVEKWEKSSEKYRGKNSLLESELKLMQAEHSRLLYKKPELEEKLNKLNDVLKIQRVNQEQALYENKRRNKRLVQTQKALVIEIENNTKLKRHISLLSQYDGLRDITETIQKTLTQEEHLKSENEILKNKYKKLMQLNENLTQSLTDKADLVENQKQILVNDQCLPNLECRRSSQNALMSCCNGAGCSSQSSRMVRWNNCNDLTDDNLYDDTFLSVRKANSSCWDNRVPSEQCSSQLLPVSSHGNVMQTVSFIGTSCSKSSKHFLGSDQISLIHEQNSNFQDIKPNCRHILLSDEDDSISQSEECFHHVFFTDEDDDNDLFTDCVGGSFLEFNILEGEDIED